MHETPPQRLLHARTREARRHVLGLLIADADARQAEDPDTPCQTRKLAHRLSQCGATPVAYWSETDARLVIARGLCKSRLCPTCSAHRSKRMEAQVGQLAAELDSPRLLTLTLRASDEPLEAQLRRLRQAFRRLRQRRSWKRHVSGGVCVIEVTYNPRTDRWHPHIHALIDATYWPQSEIADMWEAVTGDSRIVDIRLARSRSSAVRYLVKYVSKSATPKDLPVKRVAEWADAVHGLRLFQPFGTLHGRDARDEQPAEREPLKHLAPLTPIIEASQAGDVAAQQILADLRALRTSDDGEAHASVARMLEWWWATFTSEQQGREPPSCPTDAPPSHRQSTIWADDGQPARYAMM